MKKYIVLLIIAVMAFILVEMGCAAFVRIQDASKKAADRNNLKRIALATIDYTLEGNGLLPQATYPNPSLPPEQRLSWMVAILPHLEQEGLHGKFDLAEAWDSEKNLPLSQTSIPRFRCPTAGHPEAWMTSYVGMAGVGPDAASLAAGDPRCGAFGHDRKTRYPHSFTDGASTSILFIETSQANGPWAAGGSPTLREVSANRYSQIGPGTALGYHRPPDWYWHNSSSSGVTLVALGDGSAREIKSSISLRVLLAATTIAAGDILDYCGHGHEEDYQPPGDVP